MNETLEAIREEWRGGGLERCLSGTDTFLPCLVPPRRVVRWDYEDEPDLYKTTMDGVDWAVARAMDVSVLSLHAKRRSKSITIPRFLSMYLISEHCPLRSLPDIGNHFRMDHTSVMYGIKRAKELIADDPDFSAAHKRAESILMGLNA